MQYALLIYGPEPTEAAPEDLMLAEYQEYGAFTQLLRDRNAMLAGARDFLTKPPMADELIGAVRRAGSMAKDERGVADWANAHVNVRKAQGHVLRCDLFRVQPGPGSGMVAVNPSSFLSRGKVDAKVMWITVTYSELGVSPGQSVRIFFMDQGNAVYADGETLPGFRIQLQ